MRHILSRPLAILIGITATVALGAPLQSGSNGTILLDGKVWRGIGVNYYDAFNRTLYNTSDTSYRKGFATLDSLGIPFVRLAFSGYDSSAMRLYKTNKPRYFQLMDDVVASAQAHHVGLIPSLIWNKAMPGQMTGEAEGAFSDTNSAAFNWARTYVAEVVARYRDRPGVWAWEIGNEYYPLGDLPNANAFHNDWTTDRVRACFRGLAKTILEIDSSRILSSGNELPAANQYHRALYRRDTLTNPVWWTYDTREQHKRVIDDLHPNPIGMISTHLYPFGKGGGRFFTDSPKLLSEAQYIGELAVIARELGKPLFVGEFGVYDGDVDSAGKLFDSTIQANYFSNLLHAILDAQIPLAAMWVYDFDLFNPPGQASLADRPFWTATLSNNRAYQLKMVADANAKIRQTTSIRTKLPKRSELRAMASGGGVDFFVDQRLTSGTIAIRRVDGLIVARLVGGHWDVAGYAAARGVFFAEIEGNTGVAPIRIVVW